MARMKSLLLILVLSVFASAQIVTQQDLNNMAENLKVTWDVVTNTKEELTFQVEVTLENGASSATSLSYGPWEIHFNCIFPIHFDLLGPRGHNTAELPGQGVNVTHFAGSHFYFSPNPDFITLAPGAKRKIKITVSYWSVARTDAMHNWYMTTPNMVPAVIASTQGEDLAFVTDKTTIKQWKRYDYDYYNPYTLQERYERNYIPYSTYDSEIRVIPKPADVTMFTVNGDVTTVNIDNTWYVGYIGEPLRNSAQYLSDKLSLDSGHIVTNNRPGPKVIYLEILELNLTTIDDVIQDSPDAYTINVDVTQERVHIIGNSASGAFYGAVTLLSLMDMNGQVPGCFIVDSPRFEYRGLMLDIARTFHDKAQILEIIELMSSYKLNKLHLHMTDDEGWRVEIPELPELTQLGSQRCHDPTETVCLMPELGSGPDNTTDFGSGFLTANDYVDIVRFARDRHVTVIPEVDMPGHARAAIKAMELRLQRLSQQGQREVGESTLLTEPGDPSEYLSNQMFSDNAINTCQNSTYNFISIVMDSLIQRHNEAGQPLTVFHFGGDEVGRGAWVNSTQCNSLKESGVLPEDSPKAYFFEKVSELAAIKGLSSGAWEDGLIQQGATPFNISTSSGDIYAYAWDNVWEWGTIARTYTFANRGYKVVMAHGTHVYFDHPYEPDPEERGYYWATRFTDTKKTFSYNAVRYYDNFHVRRSGQPVTEEEKCGPANVSCPDLVMPENIVGMQGTLFGETNRNRQFVHSQLFPRLLAMAERAWHKASWEDLPPGAERDELLNDDWFSFARAVGHRELPRLEKSGVPYRIPPPGAKVDHGRLLTTPLYPGLQVQYSLDAGATWMDATPNVQIGDYMYRIWLRTRNSNGSRFSRTIVLDPVPPTTITNQPVIDYISENLAIKYTVVDNYIKYGDDAFEARIEFHNTGEETIPGGNWKIYFTHVQVIEREFILQGRMYVDPVARIEIGHAKGYLYTVGPARDFQGLPAGEMLAFNFKADYWSVSRYEQMPRWYVTAPGMTAKDIKDTVGEDLDFVTPFTKPEQWKRMSYDKFEPWTPKTRFSRNQAWEVSPMTATPVLPTPVSYTKRDTGKVDLTQGSWTLVYGENTLMAVAQYFNDTIAKFIPGLDLTLSDTAPTDMYIRFRLGNVSMPSDVSSTEGYSIQVNAGSKVVEVISTTSDGAFYGAVTLIHMAIKSDNKGSLPACDLKDWPRFSYRGMHADTARNFIPKEKILTLLDAMGLYKLNKLHFHLSDDEGWRVEIPTLPELTQIASRRCHDPDEEECVMSTMGSGAKGNNSGSGYYSVDEYKEILQYAADRHIQVIPEFDMPGHAHSAIIAMQAMDKRLKDLGEDTTSNFRMDDVDDTSHYYSVQYYSDNAVNPCIESTYRFIEEIFTQMKELHKDIQPLTFYHFGGDEVAHGAWANSTACVNQLKEGVNLKEYFTLRVAEITKDVTLGAWEDGLMAETTHPWNRTQLPNTEIVANAWQNVWEWGVASRAYNLANAGYKVVFSPVTHLYFDHPQEPSPEERGFYWGTRYTDAFKSFSFMPDDYYLNADIKRSGEPITLETICTEDNSGCPPLEKPENILGLQGQLWAETVRTPEQFYYMVFPRLLTLSERAWHKGSWEGKSKADRQAGLKSDWAKFATSLGKHDLAMLDTLGVAYRVPPPGAKQDGKTINTNVEFPGLKVQYKTGNSNWNMHSSSRTFSVGQKVNLRTVSADGTRYSSEVSVTIEKESSGNSATGRVISLVSVILPILIACLL